jgi:TrmH family RNA methyltransferase
MAVKAIQSRDNPLLVRLRKLVGDPAGYRKHNLVWLEGDHLCSAFVPRPPPRSRCCPKP